MNDESNVDRLRAEGFNIQEDSPQEYIEVIEGFSGDQVDTLIELKHRLDDAKGLSGVERPWHECFFPF